MSETKKKPVVEEAEETSAQQEKKPVKKAATKEKEGILTRGKNWMKRNKKALIAGAAGLAAGVGGTIAVGEVGKRRATKRAVERNAYIPQGDVSPLDPNV